MNLPLPLSVRTALEDAIRRLEEIIDTDCECDTSHPASEAPCALCQAREALQQDDASRLGHFVMVEDQVAKKVWTNTYLARAFPTAEAAIAECRKDCISGYGYDEDDPSHDSQNITVAFVARGDIGVIDAVEWRGHAPYTL